MHRHSTLLCCLILVVAMAFSLIGCQQPSDPAQVQGGASSTEEPIELVFWDMAWGTAERYQPAVEKILAQYQTLHPNITFKYTNLPWANWFEVYSTAAASGSAPDVAIGGGYMPFQFAPSNESADLQWIIRAWEKEGTLDDFPEGFIEYYRYRDKQVGIPFNIDPRAILVRKDWLEDKGLAEPETWVDFMEMCKAFRDPEQGIYGYAFGVTSGGAGSFTNWAVNNGGMGFDRKGNANIDSDNNLLTMKFFSELKKADVLPEGIEHFTGDDAQKLFIAGKVGAVYGGPDWVEAIVDSGKFTADQLTVLHPLKSPAGIQKNALYFNGYMVFQQSEHRDEAMAFLKWFSENNASLWSEGGVSAFPVRTSFLKGIDTLKEPLTKAPFVEYIIPNSIQTVYPMQNGTPSASMAEGEKYGSQLMQAALTQEEEDWKPLLQRLQKELEKLIAEND